MVDAAYSRKLQLGYAVVACSLAADHSSGRRVRPNWWWRLDRVGLQRNQRRRAASFGRASRDDEGA